MYNENKYGFVVCRDGYILVTNKLSPQILHGYIKTGPAAVTSHYTHYFPIVHTVAFAVLIDSVYLQIRKLNDTIKHQRDVILKTPSGKRKPQLTLDYIARCTEQRNKLTETLLRKFSSRGADGDDRSVLEENLTINSAGVIDLLSASYEKDEADGCKRSLTSELLPVSEGTEWVICHDRGIASEIEAALRSTKTKEELLKLLQKLNFIKEEVWLTPAQYLTENNIVALMKKALTPDLEIPT